MQKRQNGVVLPEFYNPQVEEKKILRFWQKEHIFSNVVNARREENSGKFEIHSGPVFPTGFPHSGHVLNSVAKDAFTRFAHMSNLQVENSRFGWDCHGLPVEHEVDKRLGIETTSHIQEMGIPAYNEECRDFIKETTKDWPRMFEKLGNWMDFTNTYNTMDTDYMEKVWGVFKQLYDKGLVYRDTKVQPYSTGCFTQLSNFEAKQNCKEVTETATIVSVNIVNSDDKLLVWTTNPWSLVSNSAVCVKPKAIYVKVKVKATKVIYIVSKNCLGLVWKTSDDYEVLEEISGESLQDLEYEPLFKNLPTSDKLSVILDDSVSNDIGTGIVPLNSPMEDTLAQRGHVLKKEKVKYDKPYCWRSDTPLINKHTSSWFVRVTSIANQLLDNASKINWSPRDDSKTDLMKWLNEHLSDWSISRTRYWGTPVPIWSSPSGDEIVCIGSIDELKCLTGKANITFDNLHREVVDWVKIPSKTPGNPPLTRVPDVFDCWFESGIIPFAHEKESFQVDLACEGVDQTYGWFYTTLVLATALSRPFPFRNIFTLGLVLEPNGTKVSKRKHNSNDALRIIEKYGADAYRLYLTTTPMAAGQNSKILEKDVAHITEAVINPLFRIFKACIPHLYRPGSANYGPIPYWEAQRNVLNSGFYSYTDSTLRFYQSEMRAYRMHTFLPRVIKLLRLIEDWYIPLTLPKDDKEPDFMSCVLLFTVIHRLCLILAPFAPFITEYIYQIQKPFMFRYSMKESIHANVIHNRSETSFRPDLELTISRMEVVMELVQRIRSDYVIPIQYKISELTLVHYREDFLRSIETCKVFIVKLLNVQNVRFSRDHHEFGAKLNAKLTDESEFKDNEEVKSDLEALNLVDIESDDTIPIRKWQVPVGDIQVFYENVENPGSNYVVATKGEYLVVVKMNKDLDFYEEGTVKEIVSRLRRLKKNRQYYPTDRVTIYYSTNECLKRVIKKHEDRINTENICKLKMIEDGSVGRTSDMIQEAVDIKGLPLKLYLSLKVDEKSLD